MHPFNEELKILVDALQQVGKKGEAKVAEWIRGSAVSWTNAYNKNSYSYGNNKGHTLEQWRLFMPELCRYLISVTITSLVHSLEPLHNNCTTSQIVNRYNKLPLPTIITCGMIFSYQKGI